VCGPDTEPLDGPPRLPDSGATIPIRVAPAPELDAPFGLKGDGPAAAPSYHGGGGIPPDAIGQLFAAAGALHTVEPWRASGAALVLRLDVPAFGLAGACVAVIEDGPSSRSVLIDRSWEAYASLPAGGAAAMSRRHGSGLGMALISLELCRAEELPPAMLWEAAEHGWRAAAPSAFPRVSRLDRGGSAGSIERRDVEIAAACGLAVAMLFERHDELFEERPFEPTSESFRDEDGLEVRLTVPFTALDPSDESVEAEDGPPRGRERVGRDDPCPCGSGRKYEGGRLRTDEEEPRSEAPGSTAATPPLLNNTDGEPLVLTVDHFEVASGAEAEVIKRMAALDGAQPPEAGEDGEEIAFLRQGNALHPQWEVTVVGQARLAAGKLRLETNSLARADALRRRVEEACGDRIRHRLREHVDPTSRKVRAGRRPRREEPPSAEEIELVLDYKRRHYAAWPDESLPALGGRTPRQAARSAAGRNALDLLLREMENREQRFQPERAFDFSILRRELGLEMG